jgi:putative salt-induced outer membrane protein YdiY
LRYLKVLMVLTMLPLMAFADQVVLKNGDRISGTIVKSDDKSLVMKTDFLGDVTVQWDAVQELTSGQPLHVGLKSGQTVVGQVSTTDGNLAIATTTSGTQTTPKDAVTFLRNDAEQTAYEKSLHPGLMEGWNGGLNLGFALTRGNSETKNLALAFTADRKTLNDHLGLYANSVYAANDAEGAVPHTTANAIQGGARYDHDLTKRLFGFVSADFQTDDLQSLDLRSVFTGGLGYHVIQSDKTTLDVLAGINYTRENYTDLQRNLVAATLGEELLHKLGGSTVLTQKLYFYPNFNESGEFRATFNLGTVTKINKWLGWQNGFGDIYVTNPPEGKRQNDILFTTGLNVSFTH